MARGKSAKALAAEQAAFRELNRRITAKPVVRPKGHDEGFPDFAVRIELSDGFVIDCHFEYKMDDRAQHGGMRDWRFDGSSFSSNEPNNEHKNELLAIMNGTRVAKTNGKRLLKDLRTYVSPKIKHLYGGSFTVIRDMKERNIKAKAFAEATDNFTVAYINNTNNGANLIKHYKTKFRNNLHGGANASVLILMIANRMWIIDSDRPVSPKHKKELASVFGTERIDSIPPIKAQLEVRVSPKYIDQPTPTTLDMVANYRFTQRLQGGTVVI